MKKIVSKNKEIITQRTEITKKFFNELKKYPVLSQQQEVEIAEKAVNGCNTSLNKLVLHNMRFVVTVAKEYQRKDIPIDDLINWGMIGCINAAKNFEPKRGFKFISYAVWWIRQSIIKGIKTHSQQIHIPVNRENQINKIYAYVNKTYAEKGDIPSDADIADKFYLDVETVRNLNDWGGKREFSINKKVREGEPEEIADFMEGENNSDNIQKTDVENILKNSLNDREYVIIKELYYNDPKMSYENIGSKLDLTAERIRQLERLALKKLKKTQIKECLS